MAIFDAIGTTLSGMFNSHGDEWTAESSVRDNPRRELGLEISHGASSTADGVCLRPYEEERALGKRLRSAERMLDDLKPTAVSLSKDHDDVDKEDLFIRQLSDITGLLAAEETSGFSVKSYFTLHEFVSAGLNLYAEPAMRSVLKHETSLEGLTRKVLCLEGLQSRLYCLFLVLCSHVQERGRIAVFTEYLKYVAGVQHPMRGFFLRWWMAKLFLNCLQTRPQLVNAIPQEFASVGLSVSPKASNRGDDRLKELTRLVLTCFNEMLILEKRLPHDDESDAVILPMFGLVVKVLAMLAVLEDGIYTAQVFPSLVSGILAYDSPQRQESLTMMVLESITSECHVQVLDETFQFLFALHAETDTMALLRVFMDRVVELPKHFSSGELVVGVYAQAFDVLKKHLDKLTSPRSYDYHLPGILSLFERFVRFTILVHPRDSARFGEVLSLCRTGILNMWKESEDDESYETDLGYESTDSSSGKSTEGSVRCGLEAERVLMGLLTELVDHWGNISIVTTVESFPELSSFLSQSSQIELGVKLLEVTKSFAPCVRTGEDLDSLISVMSCLIRLPEPTEMSCGGDLEPPFRHFFFSPLVKEPVDENASTLCKEQTSSSENAEGGTPSEGEVGTSSGELTYDIDVIEKMQPQIARLVFLLDGACGNEQLRLIELLKAELDKGGSRRATVTLPSLVFSLARLALVRTSDAGSGFAERCLMLASSVVESLGEADPRLALQLYSKIAEASAACGLARDSLTSITLRRALAIYENGLVSSRDRLALLLGLMGACIGCGKNLERENYVSISSTLMKHCGRLLTFTDQCIALCSAAEMFIAGLWPDNQMVQECLEKAVEAAGLESSEARRALLLTDVLMRSSSIFARNCQAISAKRVADLHRTVRSLLDEVEGQDEEAWVLLAESRLRHLEEFVDTIPDASKTFIPTLVPPLQCE
uniref:Uncharacterized protein n=2 Tax=Rhodosorus marinus TaxID=101924 RepID=A0A7S2ZY26_9RHOD|mmetsp:Transcript_37146/g.148184  ORF Transcript_37146/g.148184 Transcript_37146/m.148184 type:complete len:939 (+) Transcript_37146:70-2886(+)